MEGSLRRCGRFEGRGEEVIIGNGKGRRGGEYLSGEGKGGVRCYRRELFRLVVVLGRRVGVVLCFLLFWFREKWVVRGK